LFPLMVLAAAAAIAFGALGILAITGRAPTIDFPPNPLNRSPSVQRVVATTNESKPIGEAASTPASHAATGGARH